MISFPNAKINLGLRITGERNDGYHNLETVFYPIRLKDALEVTPAPARKPFKLHLSGLGLESSPEENIVSKAWQQLKEDLGLKESVEIHLHKAIPTGAGLGGGSADGAFTLELLNKFFNLELSKEQLLNYALQLGSDCPFFIYNTPCLATGRGEVLSLVNVNLKNYDVVLVNPGIHVSTAWAFSAISPSKPLQSFSSIIELPVEGWKNELTNDFEPPVFKKFPEIAAIKEKLYNTGALFALMTGSGSSVYGIFEKNAKVDINWPANYLSYRFPA